MSKKIISIITLSSLILCSFSSCSALKDNLSLAKKSNNQKEADISTYYSVTNAYADHDETHYYELDVRIPKITYSNEESDSLIDPINKEIYENITSHVEEAKKNAYETFEKFIESAENNLKNDREKKIDALKNKYKSVIGSDEVKAIARILSRKVDIVDTASDSEIEAFINSEDLIIPELHNKNIILVESTANADSIKETTMSIDGRPGKKKMVAPPEPKEVKSTPSNIESKEVKSTPSNIESNTTKQDDIDTIKEDKKEIDKTDSPNFKFKKFDKASLSNIGFKGFNRASFSDIDFKGFNRASFSDINFDEITIENFYRELRFIEKMRIPTRRELTRQFNRTHIDCSWDVKCLDGEYLSLLIDISESRAQASSKRYYYNIDLKNKKLLNLSGILGEKYKEICINSINKEIELWDDEKKSTLKSNYNIENFISDNTSFFINNNHSPVIVLDKYMITAGAVGYPEFQINK